MLLKNQQNFKNIIKIQQKKSLGNGSRTSKHKGIESKPGRNSLMTMYSANDKTKMERYKHSTAQRTTDLSNWLCRPLNAAGRQH